MTRMNVQTKEPFKKFDKVDLMFKRSKCLIKVT